MTTLGSPFAGLAKSPDVLAAALRPAVLEAVQGIRRTFTDTDVLVWPTGDGGAAVVIERLTLGPTWGDTTTWMGFTVTYLHPAADIYPHHLRPDLSRADGYALTPPFHPNHQFAGHPSLMVSRANRHWNPEVDTAALKALSVLAYIRSPT